MKKGLLIATALILTGLTACTKDESVKVQSDNAIRFGTYVDRSTRGQTTDNSGIESTTTVAVKATGFGILGYQTGLSTWAEVGSSTAPNFMYNQFMEWNNIVQDEWGYSPIKYWANIDQTNYSFFAYAPYESAPSVGTNRGVVLNANSATGLPTITFTLKSSPADMVDLVCGQAMNQQKGEEENTAIVFNLKHQLARATFEAKTNITTSVPQQTDKTFVIIKSMKLVKNEASAGASRSTGFYGTATYTFGDVTTNNTVTAHGQDGVWSAPVNHTTDYAMGDFLHKGSGMIGDAVTGYNKNSGVVILNNNTAVSLFNEHQYLFLIPVDGSTGIGAEKSMFVELEYDIVTEDAKLVNGYTVSNNVKTVALPAGYLQQGKAYKFIFDIQLTEVKVAGYVVDWDTSMETSLTIGLGEDWTDTGSELGDPE